MPDVVGGGMKRIQKPGQNESKASTLISPCQTYLVAEKFLLNFKSIFINYKEGVVKREM